MRTSLRVLLVLGVSILVGQGLLPLAQTAHAGATKPVDFRNEIRPLLSDNCFHCHGPDHSTRMVGLRLDIHEEALKPRKNGAPIVPGKAEESLLYKRMAEPVAAKRMPPPYAHKELKPEQIALFKRWIDEGAKWEEHWAWTAPQKPAVPAVKNAAWAKTDIDRFILARLEAEGLSPAPQADKYTLIRRVAFDLTGLPPKPAEVTQFLEDKSPDAYEKMVDRYLASPHYGEHRARYWLDAARYADSHGIHIDNYREIWPYRDWVIKAFNRNLPFDQFTVDQLAGDMLPNPTLEQRIATGFQRCNVTTNEAGIIEDEYEEIYAKDRADTVGAVWLGMTVGCATCHDHKFDPIKAADFYALGAFFRNTTQQVYDENVYDTPPILLVPAEKDRPRWIAVQDRLSAIRQEIARMEAAAPEAFTAWAATATRDETIRPLSAEDEVFTAEPFRLMVGQPGVSLGQGPHEGTEAVHFPAALNQGLRIEDAEKQDADEPFSVSIEFLTPERRDATYTLVQRRHREANNRGWSLAVADRVLIFNLTGGASDSIEYRADRQLLMRNGVWNHITVTYDGMRTQEGLQLYLNGQRMPLLGRQIKPEKLRGEIDVTEPIVLGGGLAGGAISDFRIFRRLVTESEAKLLARWTAVESALAKPAAERTEAHHAALLSYYLNSRHEDFRAVAAEQAELNDEAHEIAQRGAITHVMHERTDQTPFAHVLHRGAYDQRRERVEASPPSVLPSLPAHLPRNRLGLAQWLFLEENPMTARVTVNRMWQEVFGTGIVRTTDDFGSQGEPPVNQPLLDWMAIDFRESKWDVKRYYRQLLLSATYRQESVATPLNLEKDPQNRLLSRGPRFRMDAEMVRDAALASSGLLATRIGGPSVKPYQPEGIWEAVAMFGSNTRFYQQDEGAGLYRRSMYTFWKRSAPPASMDIFNAPTRENCTVLRERTNTPLQALVTMNDPQFFEAARVLAGRAMNTEAHFDGRLSYIAQRLLARPLSGAEQAIAEGAFSDYRGYYSANPEHAQKMLAQGDSAPDPSLPVSDFAAYTMLTNQLMNLDEVLNK
ncbi:MAG: DUF1553 domain-containing protein [Bryobacterales bacterium]|nr:DUF1553 domain-containing protein [Bryobacterales bacterium]